VKGKRFLFLVGTILLMCSIGSAAPVACVPAFYDTYTAKGFSCTIDDKLFSNFGYSSVGAGGLPPNGIPKEGVTVTPNISALNFGFDFNAPWIAGPGQQLDSVISFAATTQSGKPLIIDDTLFTVGGFSGTGSARVDETVCLGAASPPCPGGTRDKHVFTSSLTGTKLVDNQTFPAQTTVFMAKDILVTGGNGTANISLVTNTVSQVPEPATFMLIGSALVGLGVLRRKMKGVLRTNR